VGHLRQLHHPLPDNVHPNAEGYQELGRSFLREVAAKYFG
jgi:lysophospholipase L1-like esterase